MKKLFLPIGALALYSSAVAQQQSDRPNVLLIYADDIGYGDLSCNGTSAVRTPNVEKLASEGIRFTNAHCAAATSTPSRYAMLTGEYAWRRKGTGIAAGNTAMIITPDRYTMADMFKEAGYQTGVVGKWHLGLGNETGKQDWNGVVKPNPADIGFDYSYIMAATADRTPCIFMENVRPDGILVEFLGALEWLKDLHDGIPVYAGSSLNIFNSEAADTLTRWGFSGVLLSQELTIPQIRGTRRESRIPLAVYAYGRTELMVSEYCVINSVCGDIDKSHCPGYCQQKRYFLKDDTGRLFPVRTDEWCHMHIQNSSVLDMRPYISQLAESGINALCLDFRGIDESVSDVCSDYVQILNGNKMPPDPSERGNSRKISRGHFFKGVL